MAKYAVKVANIPLADRWKATISVEVSRHVVVPGPHFHLCRLEGVIKLFPRAPYEAHSVRSANTRPCHDRLTNTIGSNTEGKCDVQ